MLAGKMSLVSAREYARLMCAQAAHSCQPQETAAKFGHQSVQFRRRFFETRIAIPGAKIRNGKFAAQYRLVSSLL